MTAVTTETGAAIFDEQKGQYLPFNIPSWALAVAFLDAAERSGVNLYVGMPHSDMRQLYDLWYDAWKRDFASDVEEQRHVA